ncbi:unnamed protein product [Schistocephalus solidus]|uniref:CHAT domain-containing protein n=1 Tax=Schistocephalus solidus TaxID=70667 RepID=A0A183SQ23_SCHSO|nr:unnamed protein product [Schistocephalus solidus]
MELRLVLLRGPAIPSGYRVSDLIGFVQELVMNDDPEHQWIEKIRSSRASNEARQRLFFQLSGELQRKLSRKVLNLGGNAVIGYRLHFDLEGETGVVARAIGTAVYLQKWQQTVSPPDSANKPVTPSPYTEVNSTPENTDQKTCDCCDAKILMTFGINTAIPAEADGLNLCDCRLTAAPLEFPFLTITHLPPGLIHHFGCAVAAKSVKLLEKNVADDPSVQASWWLELRTEALTHMRHVNCNALIGYREECAIFEDVFSKPLPATTTAEECCAAPLPSATSADSAPAHAPVLAKNAGSDGSNGASAGFKLLSSEVPSDAEVQNCSLCHIPLNDAYQSSQHFTRCFVCKSALVPDFIFSSTEFPSDFPIIGRPAFIQAG